MDTKEDIDTIITKKYEIIEYMGKGSYGTVFKAIDKYRNKIRAIKKCKNIFENQVTFKKIIIEILLLFDLKGKNENIIEIEMVYKINNDLYIISDFIESDLNMYVY